MRAPTDARALRSRCLAALVVGLTVAGCGEPSERQLKNRRELEALLTAVSLRNPKELERDAARIDGRRSSGELSDRFHGALMEIVATARAGDWAGAERRAYELREQHPFFD